MSHLSLSLSLVAVLILSVASCEPAQDSSDAATSDAAIADSASPDAISETTCFSNQDCELSQRCENIGSDENPDVRCVSGERGTLAAGENCDPGLGELQCASSICIDASAESFCSETCTGDETCPEGMQRCIYIAYSDSNDMWCFPE